MRGFMFVALTSKGEEVLRKCSKNDKRVKVSVINVNPFMINIVFKDLKVRAAMTSALLVSDASLLAQQVISKIDKTCKVNIDYEVEII